MKRLAALTVSGIAVALGASTNGAVSESPPPQLVRFLAMGDSYTIGESVGEGERWPAQLAQLLEEKGYRTDLQIIARTGWTTDELWDAIQKTELNPPYDLVSLLIGVNNQYRGRKLDEYRDQFRSLLERAIDYTAGQPGRVIVLSIPDWGLTPFGAGSDPAKISREIDRFNAINREATKEAGAHYVDITEESRTDVHDRSFIAADGLHPSGTMYTAWALMTLPAAVDALSR